MNKDVIYIDADDDVTAIIGKIKKSKEKIVAVVPPKRIGAIQSAVNLRLLNRMAKNEKKQLVLITNNQALIGLAASSKIPVAKNLQSKPEVLNLPDDEDASNDDIIDGSNIPIGDHAATIKVKDGTKLPGDTRSSAIDSIDIDSDDESADESEADNLPSEVIIDTSNQYSRTDNASRTSKSGRKDTNNKPKLPNFNAFRKWLVLSVLGVAGLTALFIWMFGFAPAATVIITASTTPTPVNTSLTLGGTKASDVSKGIISSLVQTEKKDISVEFEATGQKDVGDKATGQLKVSKLTQTDQPVPAGSRFTVSPGIVFITKTDVTVPASIPCFPTYCAQSVTVDVEAELPGTDYNGVNGSATGPSGTTGVFQGDTSGGTTKMSKVVSADDIERAKGQLVGQSTDNDKKALIAKFKDSEVLVDGSFTVERGEAKSTPAVDEAVADDTKATLTIPTTFTVQAVSKTELSNYLTKYLNDKISQGQKVYSTGIDEATLSNYQKADDGSMTTTLNAVARSGPSIDVDQIKDQVKGKIFGDVQQSLQQIPGIKDVDVKFSYFWVTRVPSDLSKVTIEFKLDTESNG